MWTIFCPLFFFKFLLNLLEMLLLFYVLFLAIRHMGTQLPDQGSNHLKPGVLTTRLPFYLFFWLHPALAGHQFSGHAQALAVKVPSPNHWTAREFPQLPYLELNVSKKIQGQMKTSLFEGQNNNLTDEKLSFIWKAKISVFPKYMLNSIPVRLQLQRL